MRQNGFNGSDVEKIWEEFKDDVMETAEVVYERKRTEMRSRELDGGTGKWKLQ